MGLGMGHDRERRLAWKRYWTWEGLGFGLGFGLGNGL